MHESQWNPPQHDLLNPASALPSPTASPPANPSNRSLHRGRTDLELYSREWWNERRAYLAKAYPRGLSVRSQLASDAAAYNGNHHLPEYAYAAAAFVEKVGAESCR